MPHAEKPDRETAYLKVAFRSKPTSVNSAFRNFGPVELQAKSGVKSCQAPREAAVATTNNNIAPSLARSSRAPAWYRWQPTPQAAFRKYHQSYKQWSRHERHTAHDALLTRRNIQEATDNNFSRRTTAFFSIRWKSSSNTGPARRCFRSLRGSGKVKGSVTSQRRNKPHSARLSETVLYTSVPDRLRVQVVENRGSTIQGKNAVTASRADLLTPYKRHRLKSPHGCTERGKPAFTYVTHNLSDDGLVISVT